MRLVPALLLASVFAATTAAAPRQGLTAAPQISRVYDAIFDGRFDEVAALVLAREEGAQAGEAVGGGEARARELGERALDERREQSRGGDDLVEERGAARGEDVVDGGGFGGQ